MYFVLCIEAVDECSKMYIHMSDGYLIMLTVANQGGPESASQHKTIPISPQQTKMEKQVTPFFIKLHRSYLSAFRLHFLA